MSSDDPALAWGQRALAQERARRTPVGRPQELIKRLRAVLRPLTESDPRRCSRQAVHWLSHEGDRRRAEITFSDQTGARLGGHPALKLDNLPELQDGALLTVFVLLVDERVEKYNIGLCGRLRDADRPWFARVDLDPPLLGPKVDLKSDETKLIEQMRRHPKDRKHPGAGLCTHAWPHCHVGHHPDEAAQETRVPVPYLDPVEALQWIIGVADPTFEPCPWLDP